MKPDDDDFDPTDETDPEVRELRLQIRELEARVASHTAQIDQIAAAVAQRAAETLALRHEIAELDARYRKFSRQLWVRGVICATIGASLAQAVASLLF